MKNQAAWFPWESLCSGEVQDFRGFPVCWARGVRAGWAVGYFSDSCSGPLWGSSSCPQRAVTGRGMLGWESRSGIQGPTLKEPIIWWLYRYLPLEVWRTVEPVASESWWSWSDLPREHREREREPRDGRARRSSPLWWIMSRTLKLTGELTWRRGDAKPFQAGGKAREVGGRPLDLSDPVSALLKTCHWLLVTCRTKYKPSAWRVDGLCSSCSLLTPTPCALVPRL